jgi:uncharacterized protein YndB with AHSA1/START domain
MTETATVRVQRIMPAAPEVVFDEWLDPEALKDWMCPRPVHCVEVAVDARVGGAFRLDLDDSGTAVLIVGRYLEIDRPHRLRLHLDQLPIARSHRRQCRRRGLRPAAELAHPHVDRATAALR